MARKLHSMQHQSHSASQWTGTANLSSYFACGCIVHLKLADKRRLSAWVTCCKQTPQSSASLSSSNYKLQETLQSGTLEKLSMVRNVIVHERSHEIVGMVISRLHAQDQSSTYSLARLLEVVR